MKKRIDPFAAAAAKRSAADLVATWPVETLVDQGAPDRLVTSWGLPPADARSIVTAERSRRRV